LRARLSQAVEALRELLQGGEHAGPCVDPENMWDSCELHVAAADRRRFVARAALASFTNDQEPA
jgi:hypothetical protein